MVRELAAFSFLVAELLIPVLAWAHAEEPNSQNVFAVDDGWVLRANVGIVRSDAPTDLICEEAFLGGSDWILAAFGSTEWVTFGDTGAVMRTEDGCDFELVLQLARRPSDATAHVDSAGAAFVVNGVEPEAGEPDENGLWVSRDAGRTFRLIQPFDATTVQTTGVRYLDADTLIVSGYDRTNSGAGVAWSVDVGTGDATQLAIPTDVTYPYVLGAAGGRVVLLGRRGDQVIFWGPLDDIGQNELVASTWPSWAKLSDDGATAWVSGVDAGRGVMRGTLDSNGVATWEQLATDTTAACVEPVGEELFICGLSRFDEYDVLKVAPDGGVEGVLAFGDLAGVRCDCPAESQVGTVCPLVWRELAPYFGLDPDNGPECVPEATPDLGGEADTGPTGPEQDGPTTAGPEATGCCATTGARKRASTLVWCLLGIVLWRRRALTQKLRRC